MNINAHDTFFASDNWGSTKYFKPCILVPAAKSFKTCSRPMVLQKFIKSALLKFNWELDEILSKLEILKGLLCRTRMQSIKCRTIDLWTDFGCTYLIKNSGLCKQIALMKIGLQNCEVNEPLHNVFKQFLKEGTNIKSWFFL